MSRFSTVVITTVACVACAAALAFTQPRDAARERGPQGGQAQADLGAQLIAGLQNQPGVLGVDAGEWMSGKRTIAAWFKDKKSVVDWYYSETHMGVMDAMVVGDVEHKPLRHVKEDGPIMVLATLTFSAEPKFDDLKMPISQISIELFKPLPGGAHLGGRLAPDTFEVPHMNDLTPPQG